MTKVMEYTKEQWMRETRRAVDKNYSDAMYQWHRILEAGLAEGTEEPTSLHLMVRDLPQHLGDKTDETPEWVLTIDDRILTTEAEVTEFIEASKAQ